MQVTEFVYARVGNVGVGVVHDRCALKVLYGQHIAFKIQGPPPDFALAKIKTAVDRAGIYRSYIACQLVPKRKVVGVCSNLDVGMAHHAYENLEVAIARQTFIRVGEVAAVERVSYGQARDD